MNCIHIPPTELNVDEACFAFNLGKNELFEVAKLRKWPVYRWPGFMFCVSTEPSGHGDVHLIDQEVAQRLIEFRAHVGRGDGQ